MGGLRVVRREMFWPAASMLVIGAGLFGGLMAYVEAAILLPVLRTYDLAESIGCFALASAVTLACGACLLVEWVREVRDAR